MNACLLHYRVIFVRGRGGFCWTELVHSDNAELTCCLKVLCKYSRIDRDFT